MVDEAMLAQISPRARADVVAAIVANWSQASDAQINTLDRVAEFIAQMATETGGFVFLSENMNYSAERMHQVFGQRVSFDMAAKLAHDPVATANYLYAGRLGNYLPDDGWTFRGAGLMQLTGRGNFASRGQEIGMPLETQPDLVRSPSGAFYAAVAFWRANGINATVDQGDLLSVRLAVNGGRNGLAAARIWLRRTKAVLSGGQERETAADQQEDISAALSEAGFAQEPLGARTPAQSFSENLARFQRSRGLVATGVFDEDTLYAVTSPEVFRYK